MEKTVRAMNRDATIDNLRGFAIFWVIVVHVLYWGNFFTDARVNLVKSFCLFEMPLFFFITGASNSFRKVNGYFRFVARRFQRILIPYWVFAVICAGLSIAKFAVKGELDFLLGVKVFISWMVPVDRQITTVPYLTYALWFIPVYLCVTLILPLLKKIKDSTGRIGFAFLMLSVFILACVLKRGRVQKLSFYGFWTYIGLFYPDIKAAFAKKTARKYFLYAAAAGIAAICILFLAGQPVDMQANKFPPNGMFLAFSVTAMSLILLAIPALEIRGGVSKNRFFEKIRNLFATRSLTIFLYQVFAFSITIRLTNLLIHGDGIAVSLLKAAFCLATTLPICAGLAAALGKIEKLEIRGIRENR